MTEKSQKQISQIKVLCLMCQEILEDPQDTICIKCLKVVEVNHSQIQSIKNILSQDSIKELQPSDTDHIFNDHFHKLDKGKRPPSASNKQIDPCRCAICNKKTGIYGFTCRHCTANYCKFHRLPQEHDCQTDFIIEGKKKLKLQNPVIKSLKLKPI